MPNSPFEIKSRINEGTPLKTTPVNSPLSRHGLRQLHKVDSQQTALSLRTIIGTTTSSSSGLASHYDTNSFAYCAGSAAVLAKVDDRGEISSRFFRAQPTVAAIHPTTSFYNQTTPTSTPEGRRRTILPFRHGADEKFTNTQRRLWGDEASSKTWSARERVKAVSCVDLSPNGKFLAVGETGYNPRVNIFSTAAAGPSDVPLTILNEHSFGVRSVAFSPNSRWLATLGDANDGFLFIWSVNLKTGAARLHFTNKCTATVLGMAWCANNLITVGTRYVKVWRVGEPSSAFQTKQSRAFLESDGIPSPAPKTLSGRNCRLGALKDSTFTCVTPITDCEAILCTKTGVLCLLDDRTGNQELKYLRRLDSSTQSAAVDPRDHRIWFSNNEGRFESDSFENLRRTEATQLVIESDAGEEVPPSSAAADTPYAVRSAPKSAARSHDRCEGVIASRCLSCGIVSIDDERNIRVENWGHRGKGSDSEPSSVLNLPAHTDAVHGVIPMPKIYTSADYLTWSTGGAVNFWSSDGAVRRSEKIELEQPSPSSTDYDSYRNELRLIRASADSQWIVSGDRFGVLQIINCESWSARKARAHSAEITDIALDSFGESLLMATSSRDRTVQLLEHKAGEFELLQTFDEHVGTVNAVTFVANFLISASSDRTIIVRRKVLRESGAGTSLLAYVPNRVITLKASPTSITSPEPDVLVVATMERQILSFSITTGAATDSFKAFDAEGEDAVVLSSLNVTSVGSSSSSRRILAGFSSTDKSIRLYDFARGALLARELGHTEGISDIAVLESADGSPESDKKMLISTGLDGLIMTWEFSTAKPSLPSAPLQEPSQGLTTTVHDLDGSPIRESILCRPPLRKVLSKLDLSEVAGRGQPESINGDQSAPRLKKKLPTWALVPRKLKGPSAEESSLKTGRGQGGPISESPREMVETASSPNIEDKPRTVGRGLSASSDTTGRPDVLRDDGNSSGHLSGERSPSPQPAPPCLPGTPKAVHRANKGRLRRPPSIPSDLRDQAHSLSRRRSMGNINEFGSIGMASEQVCRTLRAYRKKIQAASGSKQIQLDELEVELLATLRAVEARHECSGSRRTKAATESDLDTFNLAALMKTSGTRSRVETTGRSHR